uniref:Sulfotransferase n=1 Tax=Osmerus mordax TaxID=8014 RepID=C1BKN4_OSMMO|nr:Amine sulfotransferase [Osmerus mordax]
MGEEPLKFKPGLLSYKGLNLIRNVHKESYLDSLPEIEIRDSDIFVITYPKSGTTWMQYVLALMFHSDELEGDHNKHAMRIVPWIEVEMDHSTTRLPRLFASHLLPSLLPQGLRKRGKIIYFARNPKDVAVSFYHFHNVSRLLEDKEDFNTFLEEFVEGNVFVSSWFDHVKDWYSQMDNFDMLFFTYEEMKKDLKRTIVKVSTFLKKSFDEETLNMIVEKSSFSNMQLTPNANLDTVSPDLFDSSKGRMLRKGKVGDWKTMFTVAQSEKFDKIYKEKMKGLPLEFVWDL